MEIEIIDNSSKQLELKKEIVKKVIEQQTRSLLFTQADKVLDKLVILLTEYFAFPITIERDNPSGLGYYHVTIKEGKFTTGFSFKAE